MTYLLIHEGEDREYLLAAGETLETDLGVLEVPDDPEPGQVVETHLDEPFTVRELRGPDLFNHLERTGAPMMPRDIGIVVGKTGLQSGDRVLDAGTGTGVLAAYLARMGVTVTTYERDPDFADVARENMAMAGVEDRVDVRSGDVTAALSTLTESDFDVVTLDTGDAAAVVERAPELLVPGGFLAVYSPFVEQAREAIQTARDAGLQDAETLETIQRALDVSERGTRPSTRGVGHTGYLTFARNP
ncbi:MULTISPECIES: tRNA (adenine-N1)-methyltransferase [Halomicrobium]|uniref:Methyltransferase domain-containing protein n=1 Tax=Halomicrobium mukohataei TaxID=57705 RepID=A0A847UG71_9EURY|nr:MULTISPECIES: tRNA (adenine-N1)-methyltransferase [unclassified Halomicrobium]MBO4246990.1 tRNA (adenine-N1)-methyltransferase [Halomicrobium sp. IBSBa]NLV11486.1 methyltransferase domain-containing protein [Halomicrobium mukohataei]QGA83565.1 tRNA (adenine57-N1/adenine58-N1)-methyltransferase catalytic subunit [Halomicrobium sp. LC1Hm]